jgi:hypothetical protein
MSQTIHDLAHTLRSYNQGQLDVVAGGAGDNVEQTGPTIDRLGSDGANLTSGRLDIAWTVSLAATKTASLGLKIQDSADGSVWNAAVVITAPTVVKTGAVVASQGLTSYAIDLIPRARYVRFLWTMDLSAADTDTAIASAQFTATANIHPSPETFAA